MKRNIKNLIIYIILIGYILTYRFLIYNHILKYNESITGSFLILLFTLSIIFYGYRKKIRSYLNEQLLKNTILYMIKYFIIIYGAGILVGFLSNSYSLKLTGILNNITPVVVIILFTELFRYAFVRANRDKKFNLVIVTLLLSILEVNLYIRYDSFNDIEQIFKFSTITILPIIMKNILCTYFMYQNDYRSSLIYRLIIDTYTYYVPIIPDFNDYILSISNLLLPFIMFMKSNKLVYDTNNVVKHTSKKIFNFKDIPLLIILVVVILMVVGIGPIKILGIKSPSMSPAINVGDAVVIDKTYNIDKLKVNDVIAYKGDDGKIIVHRITNINKDKTYITKGDSNNTADSIYVTKEKIIGKVIFKIPYIAYPSVVFRGE